MNYTIEIRIDGYGDVRSDFKDANGNVLPIDSVIVRDILSGLVDEVLLRITNLPRSIPATAHVQIDPVAFKL